MKKHTDISFNLMDEPWIPVRDLKGTLLEVNLRDALLNAKEYRGIEDDSPLVVISLYRFLLAVLHRALEGPADMRVAEEWYKKGFPKDKIEAYLGKWHERFDLFHKEHPFYQTPDIIDVKFIDEWQRLSGEEGNYNTNFLYNYSKRESYSPFKNGTTLSHIARLFIQHNAFSLDGMIRRFAFRQINSPLIEYAIAMIKGKYLFYDLILNLVTYDNHNVDEPAWERNYYKKKYLNNNEAPRRKAKGITDLYSWPSRSFYINADKIDDASLLYQIYYASGIDYKFDNAAVIDPMLSYRVDEKKGIQILRLSMNKSFWRDFYSIYNSSVYNNTSPLVIHHARRLLDRVRSDDAYYVQIYGLIKSKSGQKIDNQRFEEYIFPLTYREDEELFSFFLELLNEADETQKRLNASVWHLSISLLTISNQNQDKDNISKIRDSFSHGDSYWSHMEQAFHHLLSMLQADYDEVEVFAYWKGEQVKALQKAWHTVEIAAGTDARALRALSKSGGIIGRRINELQGKLKMEETA